MASPEEIESAMASAVAPLLTGITSTLNHKRTTSRSTETPTPAFHREATREVVPDTILRKIASLVHNTTALQHNIHLLETFLLRGNDTTKHGAMPVIEADHKETGFLPRILVQLDALDLAQSHLAQHVHTLLNEIGIDGQKP